MSAEPGGGWLDGMEMVRQLREAVGLFAGPMPISPQQAWEEALERARILRNAAVDRAISDYAQARR